MAKSAPKASAAVSFNPSDMIAGGLKDDFRGKITEAVYVPWDYEGNLDGDPVLGVRLTIDELDEKSGESLGEDPVIQTWSAGNLTDFMPSNDGIDPNEGEGMEIEPGPYAVKVGKKAALNNNTNFAHLMQTILDTGKASGLFGVEQLTEAAGSLACLEGIDAHWNRVAQKKRSGITDDGEKKNRDVLVVTEMYGYGDEAPAKGKKTAKPVAKKATKPEPEEEEEEATEDEVERDPIDAKLDEIVTEALAAEKSKTLKKGKLANIVLKAAAKDKDKAKMVKRVSTDEYLGGVPNTVFDEDEGTIQLIEEDE